MPDANADDDVTLRDLLVELTRQLVERRPIDGRIVKFNGSGFLWGRPDRPLILLSVAHTFCHVAPDHELVLSLGLHANCRGMFCGIPDPRSLQAVTVTPYRSNTFEIHCATDVREIDFAWSGYPPGTRELWDAECVKRNLRGALSIHGAAFAEPSPGGKYHFAARKMTNLHIQSGTFDWVLREQHGMSLDGFEQDGKYSGVYRFIPVAALTDDFKGSSGAPIVNDDGIPVAMVAAGHPGDGVIFGCPLLPYSRYVDLP